MPIGIYNGNSKHMQYRREIEEQQAKSPTAQIVDEIKRRWGNPEEFRIWYDTFYGKYRHTKEYEPRLRDKLAEMKQKEASDRGPYNPRWHTSDLDLGESPTETRNQFTGF